jgi:acetoin utilization deacetylase AcuC-like enzyme
VDLPDGCTDVAYLASLDRALDEVERRHAGRPPGLAFYLAGADPHENDRLGRLKVTAEGLAERDRRVFEWLRARRLPVAVSMAGGYGNDIHETVTIQARSLALAAESWRAWQAGAAGGVGWATARGHAPVEESGA